MGERRQRRPAALANHALPVPGMLGLQARGTSGRYSASQLVEDVKVAVVC